MLKTHRNLLQYGMKITTKKGDSGETSLFDGSRVGKSNKRIDLLGYLDELNSYVGLLVSSIDKKFDQHDFLVEVQSALLDIGAEIADPRIHSEKYKNFDTYALQMEERMTKMDESLDPLYNFILPGGCSAGATSHICRTKARKCERLFFELRKDISMNDSIGRFLNRISDYFFVVARTLNKKAKVGDVMWKPTVGLGI
jgi:cob(I)alamin adenosyltransferase